MTKAINLVLPHQLFAKSVLIDNQLDFWLVEEYLFFRQYEFHKIKIAFHRATLKAYQEYLSSMGRHVRYIDSTSELSDLRNIPEELKRMGIEELHVIDPTDDWLEKRLLRMQDSLRIKIYESPLFINKRSDLASFFRPDKKSFFQTTFYKQQRRRLNILMTGDGQPIGGKWTYDTENRKKYPRNMEPPAIGFPEINAHWYEAVSYTDLNFVDNPGMVENAWHYPITFAEAEDWLEEFLSERFRDFGAYEDAIVQDEVFLNHSVLSPLINVGLLEPGDVVRQALEKAERNEVPINSVEGFVRQIIGWREFIRGMYEAKGRSARSRNALEFDRKIPSAFYSGTTGITPVDDTIRKVLRTGYCHHIERLMVLGNFMLLCELDPNEVYRWFMELFVDAYDWVMVPNVYGMSQFADGGLFATKPYVSGSNYIRKMSNYPKGEWCDIWDGLFWRFISKHEALFKSNMRTAMLVHTFNRMSADKQNTHLANADKFLLKIFD